MFGDLHFSGLLGGGKHSYFLMAMLIFPKNSKSTIHMSYV